MHKKRKRKKNIRGKNTNKKTPKQIDTNKNNNNKKKNHTTSIPFTNMGEITYIVSLDISHPNIIMT